MKNFEYYLKEGKVKKASPDIELAKALIKDADSRRLKIKALDTKEFSKIIFENIYDALRNLIDSILAIDGYKSYSHEASISYLKKYSFEDYTLEKIDNFRFQRNGSKYYGKDLEVDVVSDILIFYDLISPRLKKILEDKL